MAQLRKQDILEENGIPYVRITPDAGSVKTGKYRHVPLHPQLIERGFLSFVAAADEGPLFHSVKIRREGAVPAAQVAGRISTWLQSLGIIPTGVDPSYGWRHRLKTVGRELGVDHRVLDAIQGHAARTAGDAYGDVTLKALKMTIDCFPPIGVK